MSKTLKDPPQKINKKSITSFPLLLVSSSPPYTLYININNMATHAIKKLDSSKWQSIEKVSLLQFCETTIKVLTPSALCRITVMRKKSPLLWLFSFFLFLTYSLLCTLKTHYRLTFSAHKQIHMRIEI